MSVEGAYVTVRDDVNMHYYGHETDPAKLFDGSIDPPINAKPLYDKLAEYEKLYGIASSIYHRVDDLPPTEPAVSGHAGGSEGMHIYTITKIHATVHTSASTHQT